MTRELYEKMKVIVNNHNRLLKIYSTLKIYDVLHNRKHPNFNEVFHFLEAGISVCEKIIKATKLSLEDYAELYLFFYRVLNGKHVNQMYNLLTLESVNSDTHRFYYHVERTVLENYEILKKKGYILPIPGLPNSVPYHPNVLTFVRGSLMDTLVEEDVILTYLLLIEEFLNKNPDYPYRYELLETKYINSFTSPRIEQQLIHNHFDCNQPVCINSVEFFSTIEGRNIKEDKIIKEARLNLILDTAFKELISNYVLDLSTEEGSIEYHSFIVLSTLLKSVLINYDEIDYNNSRNYLMNLILDLQANNNIDDKYAIMLKTAISQTKLLYNHENIVRFNAEPKLIK